MWVNLCSKSLRTWTVNSKTFLKILLQIYYFNEIKTIRYNTNNTDNTISQTTHEVFMLSENT